jgi:lysophospholipase L1-like esterase
MADSGGPAAQPVTGGDVPDDFKDPNTPSDVIVRLQARAPETDPMLGIPLDRADAPPGRHRLVVLGDSLTHGYQSNAIFNTDLSWPAMVAAELGWSDSFLHPQYRMFGGLPLNLEYLLRELEARYGPAIDWWELGSALFFIHNHLAQVRQYWEQGPGSQVPEAPGIMHNLAVSGYDIRDLMARTADTERARMKPAQGTGVHLLAENAGQLMSLYVLSSARDPGSGNALTPMEAAAALGNDGGIETMIIFIGANNALGALIDLKVRWSGPGYDTLDGKSAFNVWRPADFISELDALAAQAEAVNAQHIIWATVPHVTIAPIARGVSTKVRPGSRYFPYYTRPWIEDSAFDASVDPFITANQARAIDSAIDQYNDAITETVRAARQEGLDWLLMDTCGLMDRVAARRYILDVSARPPWWTPYKFPPVVAALNPPPDSRFFASGPDGRTAGGIFTLDGVHPTTTAYAILAQEFINVMTAAGVVFYGPNGEPRVPPIQVDFDRALARDTLINDPPRSTTADLKAIGWADGIFGWVKNMQRTFLSANPPPS